MNVYPPKGWKMPAPPLGVVPRALRLSSLDEALLIHDFLCVNSFLFSDGALLNDLKFVE